MEKPYLFCEDNPICFVDMAGLQAAPIGRVGPNPPEKIPVPKPKPAPTPRPLPPPEVKPPRGPTPIGEGQPPNMDPNYKQPRGKGENQKPEPGKGENVDIVVKAAACTGLVYLLAKGVGVILTLFPPTTPVGVGVIIFAGADPPDGEDYADANPGDGEDCDV